MSAHKITIEENFDKLEAAVGKLEDPDISLEEAFEVYSQGMKLLKDCSEQIDRVEKQVLKLSQEGELVPLD